MVLLSAYNFGRTSTFSRTLSQTLRTFSTTGTLSSSTVAPRLNPVNQTSRISSTTGTLSSSTLAPEVGIVHYVPRAERTEGKSVFKIDNKVFNLDPQSYDERLFRDSRQSPTRELNYTNHHWERHKSVWRRVRHMKNIFRSSPFQRLAFPDLFMIGTTATAVTYYNTEIAIDVASQIGFETGAMAGASAAVGILAAFRLNGSYGRYDEARKFWGEMNNASRDLAGNAIMWLETQEQKDRMLKLIKAFPVAMQWHLNDKGGHHTAKREDPNFTKLMYAEFYAEMVDIFQDEHDFDFTQIVNDRKTGGHVPIGILSVMRKIIAENGKIMAKNGTFTHPIYNREMDEQVQRLVGCMGMCERVLRTSMPTSFTRHTSRLMFLWSNLLPFAMYGACGPLGTVPASLMVGYATLGIEDIGVQLEEPFNILPLRQYSEGIYAGVDSIRNSYERENDADRRNLYEKLAITDESEDIGTFHSPTLEMVK